MLITLAGCMPDDPITLCLVFVVWILRIPVLWLPEPWRGCGVAVVCILLGCTLGFLTWRFGRRHKKGLRFVLPSLLLALVMGLASIDAWKFFARHDPFEHPNPFEPFLFTIACAACLQSLVYWRLRPKPQSTPTPSPPPPAL